MNKVLIVVMFALGACAVQETESSRTANLGGPDGDFQVCCDEDGFCQPCGGGSTGDGGGGGGSTGDGGGSGVGGGGGGNCQFLAADRDRFARALFPDAVAVSVGQQCQPPEEAWGTFETIAHPFQDFIVDCTVNGCSWAFD